MDGEDDVYVPEVLPRRFSGLPSYLPTVQERSPLSILAETKPESAVGLVREAMANSVALARIRETAAVTDSHRDIAVNWLQRRAPDEQHIRMTSVGSVHHQGFLFGRDEEAIRVTTQVDIW